MSVVSETIKNVSQAGFKIARVDGFGGATKVGAVCPKGHAFDSSLNYISKKGCPICNGKDNGGRKNDGHIVRSVNSHSSSINEIIGEGFKIISNSAVKNVSSVIMAVCPRGHTVEAQIKIIRDLGCPECRKATRKLRTARK